MATDITLPLALEIAAFHKRREDLEKIYPGRFVVFRAEELVGAWDTFHAAAHAAVLRFGRGPYLIRQVGGPALRLPASILIAYGRTNKINHLEL